VYQALEQFLNFLKIKEKTRARLAKTEKSISIHYVRKMKTINNFIKWWKNRGVVKYFIKDGC